MLGVDPSRGLSAAMLCRVPMQRGVRTGVEARASICAAEAQHDQFLGSSKASASKILLASDVPGTMIKTRDQVPPADALLGIDPSRCLSAAMLCRVPMQMSLSPPCSEESGRALRLERPSARRIPSTISWRSSKASASRVLPASGPPGTMIEALDQVPPATALLGVDPSRCLSAAMLCRVPMQRGVQTGVETRASICAADTQHDQFLGSSKASDPKALPASGPPGTMIKARDQAPPTTASLGVDPNRCLSAAMLCRVPMQISLSPPCSEESGRALRRERPSARRRPSTISFWGRPRRAIPRLYLPAALPER